MIGKKDGEKNKMSMLPPRISATGDLWKDTGIRKVVDSLPIAAADCHL